MTELGPEGRRLLESAKAAQSPSAADRARVRQAVAAAGVGGGAAVGLGATAGTAKAATSAAGSAGVFLKVGAAVVVASGVGAGGYVLWPEAAPPAPAIKAPAPPPPPKIEAVVEVAPPSAPPAEEVVEKKPKRRTEPKVVEDLAAEATLLHRAQSAWRNKDSQAALQVLEDHRRRYPRSQLSSERDGLRVLVLCDLGRNAEARTLAKKFLRQAPDSPLRASVEESCARPGGP
ncbi:MAG: hypothetical protein IPG45_31380 [Deltaproteobacteria bacterium]|nr:hypothetical protein [Deltaproteobacteria bacterium]